jgi:hypothetical protein
VTHLDSWLPAYEFSEHHEKRVRASAEAVRRELHAIDVARIPLLRVLMALRALPALVFAPRTALARRREPPAPRALGLMAVRGGALLCDEPSEIVIGLTGRFWRARARFCRLMPARFASHRRRAPRASR